MKSKIRRRSLEIFNLSFLDVVSVGFGAVVLLLVIIKISEPVMREEMGADLSRALERLREQTASLSQRIPEVQEEIDTKRGALEDALERLAVLKREQRQLEAELAANQEQTEEQKAAAAELEAARQELTEEMERLLRDDSRRTVEDALIGGIPVDSEYVIFVIDTSGSMQEGAWTLVMQKVRQVLDSYPQVKGLQIMSDMGQYMFGQYAGQWIPDTPARRQAVLSRMSSWAPFSNSSPVEGIQQAVQRFAAPDKKVSIFVFGDDFSAGSIQRVIDTVNQIVARQAGAADNIRIHAMGFPVLFDVRGGLNPNSIRFAALMRALSSENRGSFVGLNSRFLQR